MLDTTLPTHALTGLTAVGWRKARPGEDGPQPIWPIRGGDGTDDGDQDEDADDTGDGDQDDDRDGDDQDDDKDLGDAGKKAMRALRKEIRELKAQARQGGQQSTKKDGTDDTTDPQALREQAREEARAEVWTERVEAAAIAAAAGRLANPQLAARLLDLSDVPKNDKGRPDRDALAELIDELLDDEPYLAAKSANSTDGRRFQGGADGGARKTPKKTAASLGEAVAARLAGKTGR
ncbi:Sec-independent protein translocase protein TatA [Kitasatospora gansuensis]|uniref:Sec-independent protein translocase protein TatA n=1 Tax=Kitasatospora gansuensis TaxID=258050 RepID=A0A7W7SAR5_9ACTN|nr:hypothetical protein [Kitasatospora gansuensis]MBB4946832.1 Sec-independent protein translocase protein TatA [Kitasatospora gansuensis]